MMGTTIFTHGDYLAFHFSGYAIIFTNFPRILSYTPPNSQPQEEGHARDEHASRTPTLAKIDGRVQADEGRNQEQEDRKTEEC